MFANLCFVENYEFYKYKGNIYAMCQLSYVVCVPKATSFDTLHLILAAIMATICATHTKI